MLIVFFMAWCCCWARLAEGICGILTFGVFTPTWAIAVAKFFTARLEKKVQNGN